jgi:hypothetical protein
MMAIALCWVVAVLKARVGRALEWLEIDPFSLLSFCRHPAGNGDVSLGPGSTPATVSPATTPLPPPTEDSVPLLKMAPLTPPPVAVQPPALPPIVKLSEKIFTIGECHGQADRVKK